MAEDGPVSKHDAAENILGLFEEGGGGLDVFEKVEDEAVAASGEEEGGVEDEAEDEVEDEVEDAESEEDKAGEDDADEAPEDEPEEADDDEIELPDSLFLKDGEWYVQITVDGKTSDVPYDESRSGAMRTADYTRKTQAVAEDRKALDAARAETAEQREAYLKGLQTIEGVMAALMPAEPDWEALKRDNPTEYAEKYAAYHEMTDKVRGLQGEQMRVLEAQKAEQDEQTQVFLREQNDLLVAAVPEWADAEVARTDKLDLASHARSLGFTDEELGGVKDHRLMLLLRDSHRLHTQADKRKVARKKIKKSAVLKPGAVSRKPAGDRKKKRQEAANKKLARTGNVHDAAEAMFESMDDNDL